jgi:hypothetical protein
MAGRRKGLNVRVSGRAFDGGTTGNGRHPPPIDNNPTPSYLSDNLGWLSFAGAFSSNLPEKCRISGVPEVKSGRDGVLEHDPEKRGPAFG